MIPNSSLRGCGRAGRVLFAAALVAGAGVTSAPVRAAAETVDEPRLPAVVNAPGTWSDDEGVSGPVAAVGISPRTRARGIFDHRESLSMFAVSAVDGRATWLNLPGFSLERWGFVGGVTVSPDGRWLGWVRPSKRSDPGPRDGISGWSVMDTTTGSIRRLEVDGRDWVRGTTNELAFSGDSHYLLTSYQTPDQPRHATRGHQFVAWDTFDGTPIVLEEPGHYWLPSLGSASTDVVWSRKRRVFRTDPTDGSRTTTVMPRDVLMASWAPADKAFAYIGRNPHNRAADDRLYVGSSPATADRVVDLPDTSPIGEFLAWRDATHVVLGNYRGEVYVVDITDGEVETIDLAGYGEQMNTPVLATALWQRPFRPAAEPTSTADPRGPWRWASLAIPSAGLLVVLLRRRKRPKPAAATDPGPIKSG